MKVTSMIEFWPRLGEGSTMATKSYRISGTTLKQVQVLAGMSDMTEGELVRDLVELGLNRFEKRLNLEIVNLESAIRSQYEQQDHP